MSLPVRVAWRRADGPDALVRREWLVTNGLGGYASGTLGGCATRRYHGPLMASLAGAHGRALMLGDLTVEITLTDGSRLSLRDALEEVRFVGGLPIWTSAARGVIVEERLVVPHRQNTTYLGWRLASAAAPITLRIRPWIHFRGHDQPLGARSGEAHAVRVDGARCEIDAAPLPPLRIHVSEKPSRLVLDGGTTRTVDLAIERARGYEHEETLWSPGWFEVALAPGEEATLVASVEPWESITALSFQGSLAAEVARRELLLCEAHEKVREGPGAELVLAADQFLVSPQMRAADTARAHAEGHEARTIFAGYPWFTDWGRDTMISLEGLTLVTGRRAEAAAILAMFARSVKDGLIPNLFPEGDSHGLYHTADATLWFFHAIERYTDMSGERETLRHLLPVLEEILEKHAEGTRFGIGVDPKDGLLSQGAEGYQLTWMDAKVGDWVVTPRRGKAVEINALYYNALRAMERWMKEERGPGEAARYAERAARARASFNRRFWCAATGCLFDVVDPDDAAVRPNQVLAIALPHPVLDEARWRAVLGVVREKLLTPVGLRTLSPDHPDYAPRYDGDLRARDAAYHQGTVWPWLLGPFLDAWRKVHPEDGGRAATGGVLATLGTACIGTIAEIFDAEPPHAARGCVAQAWSVAEVLRQLVRS
jgi:predicted glycogen debranching enzyme